MWRRSFLTSLAGSACAVGSLAADRSSELLESITRQRLWRNRDGQSETWFHPRACMVPRESSPPVGLMTLQWIRGSDYFGPVHYSLSEDGGSSWSDPEPIASLGREPVAGHPGLAAGVCDVVPEYHARTGTVLALGHVVFYRGERFSAAEQLARYPVYSVRDAAGNWSPRRRLLWDDPRGAFIYTNNCGQRTEREDGTILMSFTFGPHESNRMVAGVQCNFDGHTLRVEHVGEPLELPVKRGLLEPSVTEFEGAYWMTIRAEDGHGYLATSRDGLNYRSMRRWSWDDGTPLAMSTTQQHWLTHSDGLYLVYTRRDARNENVVRWRSPLWVARVDTRRACLVRETERIVFPLVGDGVDEPDEVALMGNFHVNSAGADESWITVGEWLPKRGARGDTLLARVHWSQPNRSC